MFEIWQMISNYIIFFPLKFQIYPDCFNKFTNNIYNAMIKTLEDCGENYFYAERRERMTQNDQFQCS